VSRQVGLVDRPRLRSLAIATTVVALTAVGVGTAQADGGLVNPGKRAVVGGEVKPPSGELVAMVELEAAGDRGSGGGAPRCTWTLAADYFGLGQPIAETERQDPHGRRSVLYWRECTGAAGGTLVWVLQMTPQELAAIAVDTVRDRLPSPRGVFSPDLTAGRPAVVHVPLWFAVPAGQWAPVSATASVPGLTATVVARPVELFFAAGDGSNAVGCTGPGQVFRPGMAEPARPPECSYTYGDASTVAPNGRAWPATLSVLWETSWSASNGAGGSLTPLTTSTDFAVPVGEIQAIEQAGAR
jgi:hypothetical protein